MSELQNLLDIVNEMRDLDPEIQAQAIATLLVIAQNPDGIKMQDLGKQVRISQSSVSRNVSLLSHTQRYGRPGHDLVVAFEDPMERRRKLVRLTPKGKRVVNRLLDVLGGSRTRTA